MIKTFNQKLKERNSDLIPKKHINCQLHSLDIKKNLKHLIFGYVGTFTILGTLTVFAYDIHKSTKQAEACVKKLHEEVMMLKSLKDRLREEYNKLETRNLLFHNLLFYEYENSYLDNLNPIKV